MLLCGMYVCVQWSFHFIPTIKKNERNQIHFDVQSHYIIVWTQGKYVAAQAICQKKEEKLPSRD